MATKYEIVHATEEHALELARNIRMEDAREIWAASHITPHRAILSSLKRTDSVKAWVCDGEVACLFGVVPLQLISRKGIVWMLATPLLEEHGKQFLKGSREWIAEVRKEYSLLTNFVDARNTTAIKWLSWLGFYIYDAEILGAEKVPFHRFEMRT